MQYILVTAARSRSMMAISSWHTRAQTYRHAHPGGSARCSRRCCLLQLIRPGSLVASNLQNKFAHASSTAPHWLVCSALDSIHIGAGVFRRQRRLHLPYLCTGLYRGLVCCRYRRPRHATTSDQCAGAYYRIGGIVVCDHNDLQSSCDYQAQAILFIVKVIERLASKRHRRSVALVWCDHLHEIRRRSVIRLPKCAWNNRCHHYKAQAGPRGGCGILSRLRGP